MSRINYEITFPDKKRVDVINYLWGKSNVQRFCCYQIKKEQENEEQKSFIFVNLTTKSRISTFDKKAELLLNVEPAKSVVHNITKKYGREKGYQYFDKRGEETNLKTLKSFFMYEILINGKEPTSLIEDSYLDKDALRLFELLVNRDKYEKLKAWHEICKANAGLEQENRFKRKIYIFFIEF